jgi:N-methylhydantoinase B/oxoprolinase/acetone carboxylase alpha subunit
VTRIDPITFEVIKNRLAAIADEMETVLMRSAYSPVVKEMRDCSCALFDASGQVVAQASALPMHLGALSPALDALLKRYPVETMSDGDVFLVNDPTEGGTHLQDFIFMCPVFVDRRVIAFSVNLAHQIDVGGMAPGSGPGDAREIYQEGLRIPCVRAYEAGVANELLFRMLALNVRSPEMTLGDARAQLSACAIGRDRLRELAAKYSTDVLAAAMAELLDYSERMTRQAIADTPDGVFVEEDVIDDDGIHPGRPIRIRARVEIAGDSLIVDFDGTDPQVAGAINTPFSSTFAAVVYCTMGTFGPALPNNAGCYRPITIKVPPGSILDARPPAAVNARAVSCRRAADVLIKCLSRAVPARAIAGSGDNTFVLQISGRERGSTRYFHYIEALGCGLGARADRDGVDGIDTHTTNNMNVPIEAIEATNPILVESFGLAPHSAGRGQFRGGMGIRKRLRVLSDAMLGVRADRFVHPAEGAEGGGAGGLASCSVNGEPMPSKRSLYPLRAGDVVEVVTAGGGGFGPYSAREPELRAADEKGRVVTA